MKIVTQNRKATYEYQVIKKFEAGIELLGHEVKSIRNGYSNLNGSFAKIVQGECFLFEMHVGVQFAPKRNNLLIEKAMTQQTRPRKLLLHKSEILKMYKEVEKEGITLIPLSLYFNDQGRLKVELGLCKGKQLHDKKQSIKERDIDREMKRSLK